MTLMNCRNCKGRGTVYADFNAVEKTKCPKCEGCGCID